MKTINELSAELETKRQAFLSLFKKTKIVNNVVLIVIVLAMGGTFIWLFQVDMNLSLIIVGILIGVLFFYSRFAKSWLGRKTYDYIYGYYRLTSDFFFHQEGFSQIEISEKEGITLEEFKLSGVLKDEVGIISRNKVHGLVEGVPFVLADAGVRVERDKKTEVAFFGKAFVFELALPIEGRYIIHRRINQNGTLPSGFADLKEIETDGDRIVLGTEAKAPSLFKKQLIKTIGMFDMDTELADVTLTIHGGKAYLLLSYCDDVMNVAYQKEVAGSSLSRYLNDLSIVREIAKSLK